MINRAPHNGALRVPQDSVLFYQYMAILFIIVSLPLRCPFVTELST